jgi:S1-C subfamily serine protease
MRRPDLRPALLALAALAAGGGAPAFLRAAHAGPEDRVPYATILDRVERHVVLVSIGFQKDLEAEEAGSAGGDDGSTETYRRWRMSMRVPGFVVRDRRTVVCSDVFVSPGAVKSVDVLTRSGTVVSATVQAFLPRAGGIVLATASDLDSDPVPFPAQVDVSPETPIFVGSLAEGTRGLETWAETLAAARRRAFTGKGFSYGHPERAMAGLGGSNGQRTIDLVVRADGTPLGFRFGGSVDLETSVWKGPDVVADLAKAVPVASLKDRAKALKESSYVHQVRVLVRPPPKGDDDGDPYAVMRRFGALRSLASEAEAAEDVRFYGLAVSHDLLLVPATVAEPWVKRIERIVVEDEGDPPIEAKFEGRVRGLGAFAVRLTSGLVEGVPAAKVEEPAAEAAFLVHRVSFRGGARRDAIDYDRSLGRARGYGDRTWFASEEAVRAGSFLLDLEGRVLGFAAELLPEDAARESNRGRRGGADDGSRGVVAALFSERDAETIAKDLDRRVLPQKEEEAKRLPWLGVETEPVRGADVAEALGISAPTRDGTRGLVVNRVYAGSPAAKAGLRVDDVLLAARRTSGPGSDAPAVDLREEGGGADFGAEGTVPRPWKPRDGALVKLLAAWGTDTAYELEVLRDGKTQTLALKVEEAPRDASTAKKAKDEGTGLTVQDLTYEVRAGLHLEPDAAGVLVTEVEEGTSSAQARILENEVIREMDGAPLENAAAFAAALAKARAAGREAVRVVVLRLDRSRFVDLRLEGGADTPPPAKAPEGSRPPSGR